MKLLKRTFAILLVLAMVFSLSACTGISTDDLYANIPESTGGKDVVRAAAADDVFSLNYNSKYSLNPLIATNHSNQLVCALVYENMVEIDNNFNVISNVIDVEGSSCNAEGTLWTFKVNEGHTFHDGTPVTGKDLRYSLEYAINSDRFKGRFSSFQGASYTDSLLQVALGIGDTQFDKLMNIPVIKYGSYPNKYPIGSGPYTYNEEYTELIAFEGYSDYKSLPVDTIYLKEYPDAEGIISAFEDSYIDVVINDPSSYTNLGYAAINEVHTYATTNMHYVMFNENGVLGKYSYFRVAMQYAFDRSYLVELLNGNAVASPIPMYPTCKEYPQALASSLHYNLDMCKQILDNVGIRDYDDDGVLEYMSGSPQDFELVFVVCSDSGAKAGVVNRFAQDMASIGIKINVQELTWSDYIVALEEGQFDMYYGEIKLRNNFDITELLQVRDEDNLSTNLNYSNSKDITVENYINAYLAAADSNRASAYQALCEYVCLNTGALITIGFEKQQIISHRGVIKGIDANLGNPLYNFGSWKIIMD